MPSLAIFLVSVETDFYDRYREYYGVATKHGTMRQVLEAKRAMIEWLVKEGYGEGTVTYKLRDWLFSRQRYWGEPFPIVYDLDGNPHALPDDELPLTLTPADARDTEKTIQAYLA